MKITFVPEDKDLFKKRITAKKKNLRGGNKMLIAKIYDLTNWEDKFRDYLEKKRDETQYG